MIYQIYCNNDELKYTNDNIIAVHNTCTDKHLGELGAWHDIYTDVKAHNYTSIGIYQARRAFHKNLRILTDDDFEVNDTSVYVAQYNFNNETLIKHFTTCHPNYVELFKKCIPAEYKQYLTLRTMYPHNMLYCTANTFFKLYKFLFDVYTANNFSDININDKFFSFISERLITFWLLANNMHIKVCNVLTYDKHTNKVVHTINGVER